MAPETASSDESLKTATLVPPGNYLDHPLLESAGLMYQAAVEHCHPNPLTGKSCFPYHAAWQYLRLLGAVRSAGGHTEFLLDSFTKFAAEGMDRVLVSGAADYSMPSHILQAYADAGVPLDLVVTDNCEAPLFISRWLAERNGATVTTQLANIIEFEAERPFDAIMTTSFLGYFTEEERPLVFAAWYRALAPGGRLLVTQPLNIPKREARRVFTEAQIEGLVGFVTKYAAGFGERLDKTPEELTEIVRQYGKWFVSHAVETMDDLRDWLHAAGFEIDMMDVEADTPPAEAAASGLSGPSTNEIRYHCRFIARKPVTA